MGNIPTDSRISHFSCVNLVSVFFRVFFSNLLFYILNMYSNLGVLTSLILLWCRDHDWGYRVVVHSSWFPMIFLLLSQTLLMGIRMVVLLSAVSDV